MYSASMQVPSRRLQAAAVASWKTFGSRHCSSSACMPCRFCQLLLSSVLSYHSQISRHSFSSGYSYSFSIVRAGFLHTSLLTKVISVVNIIQVMLLLGLSQRFLWKLSRRFITSYMNWTRYFFLWRCHTWDFIAWFFMRLYRMIKSQHVTAVARCDFVM